MRRLSLKPLQVTIDALIFVAALAAAYFIRFEGMPPPTNLKPGLLLFPYILGLRLASCAAFQVYRIAWRFVSLRDLPRVGMAVFVPSVLFFTLRLAMGEQYWFARLPYSIIALEAFLTLIGVLGIRLFHRWGVERRRHATQTDAQVQKSVLLIGAGGTGYLIAREITSRPDLGMNLVGFVDDNPAKRGQTIVSVPVIGSMADLPRLVVKHNIEQVIITIASASRAQMRRIIEICESTHVNIQTVPGLHELVDGSLNISRIRRVELEDLLGREPVNLDVDGISRFVRGSHVLVTGAGGSIGSEMCRQVCRFQPESLILVERAENNLFEIHRELRAKFPNLTIVPSVADIRDVDRMERLFRARTPAVVIHAAAHKHVPLMEENVAEAIKNNVFGTRFLADIADRHNVRAFVMISSDKAVNPTSVMGATKRVAEKYVQALARRSKTRFITVRFGNVLGSAGSVVPIFKDQIAKGGPVTVTHPDMKRYFMTIPEASELVLQAATMGEGGEIYVLDMGEPVKVLTLAEQLIRLSGLKPYEDIDIIFTGVRPGEKLFEEIALDEEAVSKTKHPKIFVGRNRPALLQQLEAELGEVLRLLENGEEPILRTSVMKLASDDVTREGARLYPPAVVTVAQ